MVATLLDALTIEPKSKASACVIWLHGLGADGHDFANVIPNLRLPKNHTIRFIFPHARKQAVTINGGLIMPAWYDITAIDLDAAQDEKGLKKTEKDVCALIKNQIEQGITADRIIVMGFSQGGAVALHTALRYEQSLAGVAALSSYLPLHALVPEERNPANNHISIFMAHGFMDPVVPYWLGQKSYSTLQALGYDPSWHSYAMPHTVSLQELCDIGEWMREALSA